MPKFNQVELTILYRSLDLFRTVLVVDLSLCKYPSLKKTIQRDIDRIDKLKRKTNAKRPKSKAVV